MVEFGVYLQMGIAGWNDDIYCHQNIILNN